MTMDETTTEEVVKGSEFTSVTDYDPKVKAAAYKMFLTTEMSLTDVALDLGIDAKVVASWSRKGKWLDRKHEVEEELFKGADDQYRRLIVEHRVPTLERHLRVGKKLEDAIEKVIDAEADKEVPNSMIIKRMAESLSSATGVTARAAAVSDKPFTENTGGQLPGGGKVPLVVIGVTPSPAPEAQGTTITVKEQDND